MRTTLKYLSVACAGASLLACAEPARHGGQAAPGPSAQASYATGRQYQLAGRYAQALQAYLAALAADPDNVNARNGLATLYAEQGDFAKAIPIWQTLTANASMASGPSMAYLFANLGYALFLSGEYGKAQVALEKACLLDPLNHRSWQHLGDALYKQGQAERARQMYRQAIALRDHDVRADYAATGTGSAVGAIDSAIKAPSPPDPGWARADIRVRADGMLELYRIPAAPAAVAGRERPAASAPSLTTSSAPAPVGASVALLEIRNGNGVTGMARSLAGQLGEPGLKLLRLTNEKGFGVRQTRVEYQGAFRASAERLAERFDGVSVVEVKNCKPSDVRLVLGRDLARGKLVLHPPAGAGRVIAVAEESGNAG
jgi:Tfp pilus assembly protein PilF